jgi:hypothetical protein
MTEGENYGRRDGDTWNTWVVFITLILDSQHMPTGIRSDPYRVSSSNRAPSSSQFVRLIKYLENYALQGKKRFHSYGALAKAIQRARQSIDTSNASADKLDHLIYSILGIPGYTGFDPSEFSDMQYMVHMVLEGRDVGIHSASPEPLYNFDVRQPAASDQQAVTEQPKRRSRKHR